MEPPSPSGADDQVTNITTVAQLSGEADSLLTIRYTGSKLANAGTAWSGLGIVSGWLVRRPVQAAVAGIAASVLSLVAHYVLGWISGMFDADIWAENSSWFVAAVVFGGPLGLVGAIARRTDLWGLAARLVVPVGAVLEPFVVGMFTISPLRTSPDRFSSVACAVILIAGGAVCGAVVAVLTISPDGSTSPGDQKNACDILTACP